MAEIEQFFETRLNDTLSPVKAGLLRPAIDEDHVVKADEGLLKRLQELETEIINLRKDINGLLTRGPDLVEIPEIDASTFYEIRTDGTLAAGISVNIESNNLVEVALLESPNIMEVTKDSYVDSVNPNNNYGTSNQLLIYPDTSSPEWAVIQHSWGEYPSGGLWANDPILALLQIYINYSGSQNRITAWPIVTDWGETTITWNNKPPIWRNIKIAEVVVEKLTETGQYIPYYLDVTDYIKLAKDAKSKQIIYWPHGYYLKSTKPASLILCSREFSSQYAPRLLYWTSIYKNIILGPSNRNGKIYGTPGGNYWLTYRVFDKDNRPGSWALPIQITLPSTGPKPPTPSAPTIIDTVINNMKIIALDPNRPADFGHYKVEIYNTTNGVVESTIKTANDRILHVFGLGQTSGKNYQVRYRVVSRTGQESDQASSSTIYIPINLWLFRPDLSDAGKIGIDENGEIHLYHASGSSARTYDYVENQAALVLRDAFKSIAPYNISQLQLGAHAITTQTTTTSTSYTDLFSVTATPNGTGNARILLVCYVTAWKGSNDNIKFQFVVDGSGSGERAFSQASAAETIMFFWTYGNISAGTSHNFKVQWMTSNGQTAYCYYGLFVVLDLGRV